MLTPMASSPPPPPDGSCWNVVYTISASKRKYDGTLTLRHINGSVLKIFLSDSDSEKLADRILRRTERVVTGESLRFDSPPGYVVLVDSLIEGLFSSSPSHSVARGSSRAPTSALTSSIIDLSSDDSGTVLGRKFAVVHKPVLAPYRRPGRVSNIEQECYIHEQASSNTWRIQSKEIKPVHESAGISVIEQYDDEEKASIHMNSRVQADSAETILKPSRIHRNDLECYIDEIHSANSRRFRAETADSISKPRRIRRTDQERYRDEAQSDNSRRLQAESAELIFKPSRTHRIEEESHIDERHSGNLTRFQEEDVDSTGEPTMISNFEQACQIVGESTSNLRRTAKEAASLTRKPTRIFNVEQECFVYEEASNTSSRIQALAAELCSREVKGRLDTMCFSVRDFWVGYKLYCFGHYSHCDVSKDQFLASKMGRIVCMLHKEKGVLWGAKFDETVRHAWAMMEEYLGIYCGKDCTNLRALMEEFEDVRVLSTTPNGSLLLQLIKDDEYGTERTYNQARNVQVPSTNIFYQFRQRLNQVDSKLCNLMKSTGAQCVMEKHTPGMGRFHESVPAQNPADNFLDKRNVRPNDIWSKLARPK